MKPYSTGDLFIMAEKVPTINLLPQKNNSFLMQFLSWTLTIGRLLIILIEIVALGTFIYRFSLDMQLVHLHDKIKSDSFIVANFKEAETTFRDIQDRLATIKHYTAIQNTTSGIFSDITTMGKGKVTFQDLNISPQSAKIDIESPSPSAIAQFIAALKQYPQFTSITINKVENNSSSAQIDVSIIASLKPIAFTNTQQQANSTLNQNISSTQ